MELEFTLYTIFSLFLHGWFIPSREVELGKNSFLEPSLFWRIPAQLVPRLQHVYF